MKKLTSVAKVVSLFIAITGCAIDSEEGELINDELESAEAYVPEASTSRDNDFEGIELENEAEHAGIPSRTDARPKRKARFEAEIPGDAVESETQSR